MVNVVQLKIAEFKHWDLFLHENQSLLGRVYLSAKRKNAIDFIAMTSEEREEFFELGAKINEALLILFHPDLMNYASLGNRFKHLHVHFVPRYKEERTFLGVSFTDAKWGMNYAPYDKKFVVSKDCLFKLRDILKNAII